MKWLRKDIKLGGNKMEEKKLVEQPNSCKIAINQKGNWSGELKVYAVSIEEAMKKALEKAKQLEEIIKFRNAES